MDSDLASGSVQWPSIDPWLCLAWLQSPLEASDDNIGGSTAEPLDARAVAARFSVGCALELGQLL